MSDFRFVFLRPNISIPKRKGGIKILGMDKESQNNTNHDRKKIARPDYRAVKGKVWTLRTFGGERGIRTLDRLSSIHDFQSCAFSHSATSPNCAL
jgi:S-adenosylmethionine:diacylglycerol 3-amino-3-carboxypropyl transferase